MALLDFNDRPSRRELLWFGALTAPFFGVVGLIIHLKGAPKVAYAVWAVALLCTLVFFAVPPLRRAMYLTWMRAVYPLGWTISHLLLVLLYYGIVTPIGLVMRMLGRNPMQPILDRKATTYWAERHEVADASRYFRQF